MLTRRDIDWDDEDFRRMEKDLMMKFKRLTLDEVSPYLNFDFMMKKAIPRPKTPKKKRQKFPFMKKERKPKLKKKLRRKKLKFKNIRKVKLLKNYEKYLRKMDFPFKKNFGKPNLNKNSKLVLYESNFNMKNFLMNELLKAYQTYS